MKAVKRRAQFLDEFKRHARAALRVRDGIGAVVPRTTAVPAPNGSQPVPRNVCQ